MSVQWLDTVPSTNAFLKQSDAPHGSAVATTHQTAGRGRRGHVWQSGDGLALSVVFDGALPALPLVCALAVADALTALTGTAFLWKWPNDIVCGDRKIGGILCESTVSGAKTRTVAGIGLNLYGTAEAFAAQGLPYAGSVAACAARVPDAHTLAEEIVARLLPLAETLKRQGLAPFLPRYSAGCVTLGRAVCAVGDDGGQVRGTAVSIAPDGALILCTAQGEVAVRAGEVSVRGLYGYV